jgi:hypothetical protein
MIGWVDPRGVIAAATAAQFGGTLDLAGFDADFLTPTVFGVILGTGIVYGLTARPVARVLRVIESTPTGVAFLGATPWILDLARTLQSRGVPVLMLVTTADEVAEMARAGLPAAATHESGRAAADAIRGASIAQVLVTGHLRLGDRLLISELVELLGRRNVLRLPNRDHPLEDVLPESWTGHAFARGTTLEDIEARIRAGARVQVLDGTAGDTVMLASIRADGTVNLTPGDHVAKADTTRIGFVADAPR